MACQGCLMTSPSWSGFEATKQPAHLAPPTLPMKLAKHRPLYPQAGSRKEDWLSVMRSDAHHHLHSWVGAMAEGGVAL